MSVSGRLKTGLVGSFILLSNLLEAQQPELPDSGSLRAAFRNATLNGLIRYDGMATNNRKPYADYFANAAGLVLEFETAPFHHLQAGAGMATAFNIGSSNLARTDPLTGRPDRYEVGLFDVTAISRKTGLNRLEKLYLKYSRNKTSVVVGRQQINTPFINPQDGRMRPTLVNGVWATIGNKKGAQWEGGYLVQLSPRGSMDWYKTGASIGLYPVGVNPDGSRSGYAGQLKSAGVLSLGWQQPIGKQLQLKIQNLLLANVLNSVLLQAEQRFKTTNEQVWQFGIQWFRQDALNDGGNADPLKTYAVKGGHSMVFGGKVAVGNNRWETSVNATRITAAGRYLMPREWGRDPFYTFLPRERNEGYADLTAVLWKGQYAFPKTNLRAGLGIGYYHLPEANDFIQNKYGIPSYAQLNAELRYAFNGALAGLDGMFLYVYKKKQGNDYGNGNYIIHKVDMQHWNLVLNYRFSTNEK